MCEASCVVVKTKKQYSDITLYVCNVALRRCQNEFRFSKWSLYSNELFGSLAIDSAEALAFKASNLNCLDL